MVNNLHEFTVRLNAGANSIKLKAHQELDLLSNANLRPAQGGGLERGDAADIRQRNGTFESALSSEDEMERRKMLQAAYEPFIEDEIEQAFPGSVLTHVLTVVSDDQLAIAVEALQAVAALGGRLEGLHLTRRAETREHRLKIVGLRPHAARDLCDRLAALPGVARASVEQQISRR
jgi:hypothetical protein